MSANSDNTGKTQSGGSDNGIKPIQNNGKKTAALDDMEDEEDRYQEYKVPDSGNANDDLTKDLAMASQK